MLFHRSTSFRRLNPLALYSSHTILALSARRSRLARKRPGEDRPCELVDLAFRLRFVGISFVDYLLINDLFIATTSPYPMATVFHSTRASRIVCPSARPFSPHPSFVPRPKAAHALSAPWRCRGAGGPAGTGPTLLSMFRLSLTHSMPACVPFFTTPFFRSRPQAARAPSAWSRG